MSLEFRLEFFFLFSLQEQPAKQKGYKRQPDRKPEEHVFGDYKRKKRFGAHEYDAEKRYI